jgi:PAS domain S-box-containing protein
VKSFQNQLVTFPQKILERLRSVVSSSDSAIQDYQQQTKLGSQILLTFQKIASLGAKPMSLKQTLQGITEAISDATDFPIIAIELYDPVRQMMVFEAAQGFAVPASVNPLELPSQPTVSSTVVQTRQPIVRIDDGQGSTEGHLSEALGTHLDIKTLVCLPLMVNQQVIGTLTMAHPEAVEGTEYLSYWGMSLASYVASLIECQRLDARLRQSTQRLELAATALNGLIYDWDLPTGQMRRTQGLTTLCGYSLAEADSTMDWWTQRMHPEDWQRLESFFLGQFPEQDEFGFDYRIRHKEQQYVSLCDRGVIVRDSQGSPVRVVGIIMDGATHPLEPPAPSQLEEAERLTLPSTKVVIFQTDATGTWTFLNATWTELTGFTIAETLGKPGSEFVAPEDRQRYLDAFQTLLSNQMGAYHDQLRYLTKGGEPRWVEVSIQLMVDGDGVFVGTAGTLSDRPTPPAETVSPFSQPTNVLALDPSGQPQQPLTSSQTEDSQAIPQVEPQREHVPARDQEEDDSQVTLSFEQSDPVPDPPDLTQQQEVELVLQEGHPGSALAVQTVSLPQLFSDGDPSETVANLPLLRADLKRGLEQEEFRINYQPIISLATGKVVGFETLLRWQHPVQGLMGPSDFLANATETGLIVPIGWWLLNQACQQLKNWQQITPSPEASLLVSINLSAQQLAAPELITTIQQTLSAMALEPASLRLEISARDWAQLPGSTMEDLAKLRTLGVQLCLDQFQHDDTVLPVDQQVPLDRLKLDRTLISHMEVGSNVKTIRAITTLAQRRGLEVIAVGIETPAQLALLQGLACQEGQGYYFSAPVAAAAAAPLMKQLFLPAVTPASTPSPIPMLLIQGSSGQSEVPLVGSRSWTIGRSPECSISLPDRWISRRHAQLQMVAPGQYYLVDLGSNNGCRVNDQRITLPVLLQPGDRIFMGRTILTLKDQVSSASKRGSDSIAKSVVLLQSSKIQGKVWQEILASQGIPLNWIEPEVNLQQFIEQLDESNQPLPKLLLLDMTALKPNPYSFCRWCNSNHPRLKIILTSGTRTDIPPSERKWAIHQGALDLLPGFAQQDLFANMVDIISKVRLVLTALDWRSLEQSRLSAALLAIQAVINEEDQHQPF